MNRPQASQWPGHAMRLGSSVLVGLVVSIVFALVGQGLDWMLFRPYTLWHFTFPLLWPSVSAVCYVMILRRKH
jgi:hypothetical protein